MTLLFSNYRTLVAASLLLAFSLVLGGCEIAPRIYSEAKPGVDFSKYKHYAFIDQANEDKQLYDGFVTRSLRDSISAELSARGLVAQDQADLLVNYHVNTKSKIRSTSSPSVNMGYYGYRGRAGYSYGLGYGNNTEVREYTEGTLTIDIVDAQKKELIWSGVAVNTVRESDHERNQQLIKDAVQRIFSNYPVAPAVKTAASASSD